MTAKHRVVLSGRFRITETAPELGEHEWGIPSPCNESQGYGIRLLIAGGIPRGV